MKPRIYLDTSVIGGCEDSEFRDLSRQLLQRFKLGESVAVLSEFTITEVQAAPVSVRTVLEQIPGNQIELVAVSVEAEELAAAYISEQAISAGMLADALHIALATIARVDVLVSWNFKHIVNLRRIHAFNAVNLKKGYPLLEIRSPREVVEDE